MDDLIRRADVMALAKDVVLKNGALHRCIDATQIYELPSAHPELDEWCTNCKEYDHERHCCPRFNRVIRESLAEIADERLVPKKPYTYYSNPPYKTLLARCPNCKRPLRPGRTYRNPDLYCPRCGQAIDWSEVKE